MSSQLARDGHQVLELGLGGVAGDVVAVDAVARLVLVAHRQGCAVTLRDATAELRQLLELSGLSELLDQSSDGGSPNSGNSRSVSRKNVSSPTRSPRNPSTWRAHGE